MAKKDDHDPNEKEHTMNGCYGEHVSYEQLDEFLADAFLSNRDAELAGSDERFAICIWGHSGIGKCVAGDTIVETNRGMMPIRDLFPSNAVGDEEKEIIPPRGLCVLTPKGMKSISCLYYGGVKKSVRIKTETGRVLVGSQVHPVRSIRPGGASGEVCVPFRTLEALHVGDYVGISLTAKGNSNNKGIPSDVARQILIGMKDSHLVNGGKLTKKAIHSCPLNRIYDRAFLKHSRWTKDVVRRIAEYFDRASLTQRMELEHILSYEYERVIAVEENGEIPLYDLCVPDGHEFNAGGFAVHNTAKVKQHSCKPVEWGTDTQGKPRVYQGYAVFDVPIAQFEEMGDLHGMPSRHVKIAKAGDGGPIEQWVPEEVVHSWLKSEEEWDIVPSAGVRTMYAPPDWVPAEPGPSILLLDDWNRTSVRIIKGIMQLLQNYSMVSWRLPLGCNIVLTANPDEQDYLVTSIDNAILTRIHSVTLVEDAKEWSVWAQSDGLDPRGISYVLRYPEMMIGKERTNPRTLAQCFRDIKRIPDLSTKESQRRFQVMAKSLLDDETVSSLMVFMERDVELIVEPDQILAGRDRDWISGHLEKLMGGREKRVDVLGVICDRLFAHLVQPGTKPDKKAIENFQWFVTLDAIPEDMRHNLCLRLSRVKDNGKSHQWILHNQALTKLIMAVV